MSSKSIGLLLLAAMLIASPLSADSAGDVIVREAKSTLGIRYAYGRADERRTDCAGLVRNVAAKAGIQLPRSSREQYSVGRVVKKTELLPGDLVFFKNTYRRGVSHVGIYIGNGEFVHAASRKRRVMISRMDDDYFSRRFAGARRLYDPPAAVEDEAPSFAQNVETACEPAAALESAGP